MYNLPRLRNGSCEPRAVRSVVCVGLVDVRVAHVLQRADHVVKDLLGHGWGLGQACTALKTGQQVRLGI